MRRFFFTSFFLHGIFLMLLFSWEMPLADKLVSRNIIQVALVEKAEEEAPVLEVAKSLPKPQGERKILESAPAPSPGKKEEKRETPREVVREEKIEKEKETQSEEKRRAANTGPYPDPVTKMAPQFPGNTEIEAQGDPVGETNSSGLKEGSRAILATALQPDAGKEGISLRGGEKLANLPPGDEGKSGTISSPLSHQEGDPVLMQIMRRIEAAKRYPKAARKMGIEGKTVVRFKLKPGGQVEAAEIFETSGSDILDKASLETVRDAAPLPYKEGWLKVGIVFKIL